MAGPEQIAGLTPEGSTQLPESSQRRVLAGVFQAV
jgi:hypothetical protein